MAFDAGMLRYIVAELNDKLTGGRVDKVFQPSRDEVVLLIRAAGEDHRLIISAGGRGARMNITEVKTENPQTPPMFCMMLRKHFSGAKFLRAVQMGFERAAILTFATRDEMGFECEKNLILELMGRFSNIIVTREDGRIIGLLKPVDFTTSEKRQLLSGMKYEMPPKQDKLDPTSDEVDRALFNRLASEENPDREAEKFIMSTFAGIAPVIAREIAYRAAGKTDATMKEAERELCAKFFETVDLIKNLTGRPYVVYNSEGVPAEYAFMELRQYGADASIDTGSFGKLIDTYFSERAREDRLHKKASDIFRLLTNAENRITKKLTLQRDELASCDEGEKYKLWGDLITANIYRLSRGMESARLENYYSEDCETIEIPLDKKLPPSANAQVYYKKYNKSKAARVHLCEQIKLGEAELEYIYSVADTLSRAEGERELSEIRAELYHSGYASRMKNYSEKKQLSPSIAKYVTTEGYTVLCGRNNIANDYLTTKLAERQDWWFHVKNQPGSHVVLVSKDGEDEPTALAFTEAAEIAAHNSKASGGVQVPVDYTRVAKVKKPAGSKPGFVIYTQNWTAYVTPDAEKIAKMKQK